MASNIYVTVDKLNDAIKNVLDEYNADVVSRVKKKTSKAMSDLVSKTKATANVGKRKRHYRDSITSKVLSDTKYGRTEAWYVKGSDYRLTHLLNNGHALRNGDRYPGTNFLGKAVDEITEDYIKSIEEVLKNG